MAKSKKSLISKKRILSAAGLFAAGSILGAAVTEPPNETANISYSLLDTLNEENTEAQKPDIENTETKSVQTLTNQDTTDTPDIIEDIHISETEANANWFIEEETVAENISQPDFIPEVVETELSDDFDWSSPNIASENETVIDDWFDNTEETSNVSSEVSPEKADWMTEDAQPDDDPSPVVILSENSSMTPELVAQLEGIAFFWAPSGEKIHIDPTCRSFKKGIAFAGTLIEAQTVRTGGWCGICSKSVDPTYNFYATREILEACYTYHDFLSGIPSDAFTGR